MSGIWRPERRNRNIGQPWSGYSKSNDMRIPESWRDKLGNHTAFYERMGAVDEQSVAIGDSKITILYEQHREGFSYGCQPADVVALLRSLECTAPGLPDIIAFRQPTRKQVQQSPIWGRFIYFAEFGIHAGSAIVLEAQELGSKMKWSKRMSMDDRSEFKRLISDGHKFTETKRYFESRLDENAIRNTMLYRTLLHELGHLAHYQHDVIDESTTLDKDQDIAEDLYFSKPSSEREVFAHAYAEKLNNFLRDSDAIPFDALSRK